MNLLKGIWWFWKDTWLNAVNTKLLSKDCNPLQRIPLLWAAFTGCALYRNGEWLSSQRRLCVHVVKTICTTISTIDENFLTGPVGCHSVYTWCTFLLTSEANQYSKYPLEKYCSYELVFSSLRECHHHHLMLYQTYLIFVHLC